MESNTSAGQCSGLDGHAGHGAVRATAVAANGQRRRHVFAGEESQLRYLRRWLASLLPSCEARDDVVSIATELASNAIRHTASGRGGSFALEITCSQHFVRVAVADGGGTVEPRVIDDPSGEHGRGLLLVRGLAARTGVEGDQRGRLVWADVVWEESDAAARASAPDQDEAAIRDGEASLAGRFAGVTMWLRRSMLPGGEARSCRHRPVTAVVAADALRMREPEHLAADPWRLVHVATAYLAAHSVKRRFGAGADLGKAATAAAAPLEALAISPLGDDGELLADRNAEAGR